jgi:hypothetical protein
MIEYSGLTFIVPNSIFRLLLRTRTVYLQSVQALLSHDHTIERYYHAPLCALRDKRPSI